ncbi:ParB/RepB/Spo0J family partition protein [Alistipes shahii]|uniref:ParB/RepB/Spo0J family partition protein n=1 Tax=Alistipes shahii TaxID=328814 RepID=UPI003F7C038D
MKTNKANANTRKNTKTSKGKTQNPANVETAALQSQEMTAAEEQPIVEDDAVKTAETASAEMVGQGAADDSAPAPASEPEAGVAAENVDAVALLPAHAPSSPLAAQDAQALPTVLIDIHKIVPNPKNPRTNLDELEPGIIELAENIRHVGILQPICVRPTKDGMFEIVYGYRRYSAAIYADLKEVLAIVRELSDDEAEDLAITENLQREDVTPLDEAAAFKRALDTGRHTYEGLSSKFGKSESYIHGRMKLNYLIPEMAGLLKNEEINVGVAIEIAKYEAEIQQEVYRLHFKNDDPMSWKNVRIKEIAKRLYDQYMPQLDRYNFDMSECNECGKNTRNQVLFKECAGECGACQDKECLYTKNAHFLRDKAIQMLKDDPRMMIAVQPDFSIGTVLETLNEQGYEVTTLPMYIDSEVKAPEPPESVDPDAYEDEEKYNKAVQDYESEMEDFKADYADFEYAVKEGRIRKYALIEKRDVRVVYQEIEEEEVATDEVDAEGRQVYERIAPEPPIEVFKRQDEAARVNHIKKSREEIRDVIKIGKVTRANLKTEEKQIVQYAMLMDLIPDDRFDELGVELDEKTDTDVQVFAAVKSLTPQHLNMILRMYIQNFLSGKHIPIYDDKGEDVEMKLLEEFADLNYKKEADEIRARNLAEYEKKHAKFLEQIAAIEQQEAETTAEEDPDAELEMLPAENPESNPDEYPFIDDPETVPEPILIPIEPDEDDEPEMLTSAA